MLKEILEETKEKVNSQQFFPPQPVKDYKALEKKILKYIDTCLTQDMIDDIRSKFLSGIKGLKKMVKKYPDREDDIKEHIHWCESVGVIAVNSQEHKNDPSD